jgi:predicted ester cyclase
VRAVVIRVRTRRLESFYRAYLRLCNDHHFDRLGEFVADDVEVNGEMQGLPGYVAGLRAVVDAFPDYRWNLRHLLVDPPLLSAHFTDTGTQLGPFRGVAATGRTVSVQEFAVYRVDTSKIVEVWVAADDMRLLAQLG